jgi:hypothetical protein
MFSKVSNIPCCVRDQFEKGEWPNLPVPDPSLILIPDLGNVVVNAVGPCDVHVRPDLQDRRPARSRWLGELETDLDAIPDLERVRVNHEPRPRSVQEG